MLFCHLPRVLSVKLLVLSCVLCTFSVQADERLQGGGAPRFVAAGDALPLLSGFADTGKRLDTPHLPAVVLPPADGWSGPRPVPRQCPKHARAGLQALRQQMAFTEVVSSWL